MIGSVKILAELRAKLAQFFESQLSQFDTLFKSIANGVPDLLMRHAEGNTLVHQISGRGHRIQVARLRGLAHALAIEFERRGETRHRA